MVILCNEGNGLPVKTDITTATMIKIMKNIIAIKVPNPWLNSKSESINIIIHAANNTIAAVIPNHCGNTISIITPHPHTQKVARGSGREMVMGVVMENLWDITQVPELHYNLELDP
jgi:hypothetical protein